MKKQLVKLRIHIQSLWNITKTVSENTHTYTELVEHYKDSQWKYAYIYRACGTLQRQSVKIRIHIQSLWNITKTVSENTHTYTELVEHYKDSQWKYAYIYRACGTLTCFRQCPPCCVVSKSRSTFWAFWAVCLNSDFMTKKMHKVCKREYHRHVTLFELVEHYKDSVCVCVCVCVSVVEHF